MRVCFLSLFYDQDAPSPEAFLDSIPLYRGLPRAVRKRGMEAYFVHLFSRDAMLNMDSVCHHFVREPAVLRRGAEAVARLLSRPAVRIEFAWRTLRRVRDLDADVVHVHGADHHLNLALMRVILARTRTANVLHVHGGLPSRRGIVRCLQAYNYGPIDRFLFTTRFHAMPFVGSGLISEDRIASFMEVSSLFERRSRESSRKLTGMSGRPVFLWSGRLHPVKDPLTALAMFEKVLSFWPEAQLYMFYRSSEMLQEVRTFLGRRPHLQPHVSLRGRAPYEAMEDAYNSADFFLQASLSEFSGCAVIEALSCGAVPVVTDIPSFRVMTDGGRLGVLFPPGDSSAAADRLAKIALCELEDRSWDCRAFFDSSFSFDALAEQLESIYGDVVRRSRARTEEAGAHAN